MSGGGPYPGAVPAAGMGRFSAGMGNFEDAFARPTRV